MPLSFFSKSGSAESLSAMVEVKEKSVETFNIKCKIDSMIEAVGQEMSKAQSCLDANVEAFNDAMMHWCQACSDAANQLAQDSQIGETTDVAAAIGVGAFAAAAGGMGFFTDAAKTIAAPISASVNWRAAIENAQQELDDAREKYNQVEKEAKKDRKVIAKMNVCSKNIRSYTDLIEDAANHLEQILQCYRQDRVHNLGLIAGMEVMLSYNNIMTNLLPLFDRNDDPNDFNYRVNPRLQSFAANLRAGLNEIERLNAA